LIKHKRRKTKLIYTKHEVNITHRTEENKKKPAAVTVAAAAAYKCYIQYIKKRIFNKVRINKKKSFITLFHVICFFFYILQIIILFKAKKKENYV